MVHELWVRGWIRRAHVIDGFDQSSAEQVGGVAVDDVASKAGVLFAGEPFGQCDPTIAGVLQGIVLERGGFHDRTGFGVGDFSPGVYDDDRFTAKDPKLGAVFACHACKEGGEPIVVVLAIAFVGMMVALGTLQSSPEEQLSGRFGQIRWVVGDAVVIGWPIREDRTFGGDQLADKFAHRFVGAKRFAHPIVQCPHSAFA